jgi:hypothetical protein
MRIHFGFKRSSIPPDESASGAGFHTPVFAWQASRFKKGVNDTVIPRAGSFEQCTLSLTDTHLFERRCSVTRRQEMPDWNKGAIGAFTAAAWFGAFIAL